MSVEDKGIVPLQPNGMPVGSESNNRDQSLFQGGRPRGLTHHETAEVLKNWFRAKSLAVLAYGTGCGGVELGPLRTRFDMARWGISGGPTPKHANVFIISGYLSIKTLKRVIRTYEQMQDPKWVVALGACTINGGMYWDSYSTIKQLDQYLPVDMFVTGCMPRPEAILAGFNELMDKIKKGEANGYLKYQENFDWYRENQKKVIKDWTLPEYNW